MQSATGVNWIILICKAFIVAVNHCLLFAKEGNL